MQVIMLDTRYFRSPLKRKDGPRNPSDPYEGNPDPTTTILGEDQWRWLGEQLRVPAELRLLVSSIQVVAGRPRLREVDELSTRARAAVQH